MSQATSTVASDLPTSRTYPRQRAQTRGFQLGRPRQVTIAGSRVLFLRSDSGIDPSGHLWAVEVPEPDSEFNLGSAGTLNADGAFRERCLVRADQLPGLAHAAALPPEELARRERMREVTGGITAFDVDRGGDRIVFSAQAVPYLLQISSGQVWQIPAPGPVVDPRIDPTGRFIAFVVDRSLWAVELGPNDDLSSTSASFSEPRLLCAAESPEQSWGLADFIGAEELDRSRGYWWASDGSGLLVEFVDSAAVQTCWISDPAEPTHEPQAHRYPAAGTANASLQLWWVPVTDASPEPLTLPLGEGGYEYLASVRTLPRDSSGFILTLFSRDQRTRATVRVWAGQPHQDRWQILDECTDPCWVDVLPGVPTALARDDGALEVVDIKVDPQTDTYRLICGDRWLTPPGLQLRGVIDIDPQTRRITALASREPEEQHLIQVDGGDSTGFIDGYDGQQWLNAVVRGNIQVTSTSTLRETSVQFAIRRQQGSELPAPVVGVIESVAEAPAVQVTAHLSRAGLRRLPACLLLPSWWRTGGAALPVICSPYGGPHAQRVIAARGAYSTEQWLADQGFAVVVIDGRGTPGLGPAWERAVHLDVAEPVLTDQIDGLYAVAEEYPYLDLSRVGIRGWSFGGYLAALAVLERPDVFHAAVAGAPVTDWRWYDTAYSERYLQHPTASPDDTNPYERSSLIPRARRAVSSTDQRPLLLIHGLADDNVLAMHTLQLSTALLGAGRAHDVLPLSGVTHMTPQEVVTENLLLLERAFFSEHLHPAAPAD